MKSRNEDKIINILENNNFILYEFGQQKNGLGLVGVYRELRNITRDGFENFIIKHYTNLGDSVTISNFDNTIDIEINNTKWNWFDDLVNSK